MDVISEYFSRFGEIGPDPVIDIHGHMGQWFNFSIPGRGDEDILDAMARYGIGHIVLSHLKTITGSFTEGNREAMAFAARHPEQVSAYIGVDPHYPKQTMEELTRWVDDPCAAGIKLHPETHRYSILDPVCQSVFRFANDRRLPVLIHIWGPQAARDCAQVALENPGMQLIMGHSGGPEAYREAVWAAQQAENIVLDITGSYALEGQLEWTVEKVGANRIVFGSDMPFIDAKHTLGRVLYSALTLEQKRMILSGNAGKLLRREEI